jgi:hypothetical protein
VIKIRYSSELQPGLNGKADRRGRDTVVYLLPGLTPVQRAAALRRLRQHGRMGIGPRLPAGQLLIALFADRIRTTFGQAGAIVRTHPAGSTLPVVVVSAAVAGFLVLSAVSIRVIHQPQAGGPGDPGSTRIAAGTSGPAPDGSQRANPGQNGPSGQPGDGPVSGAPGQSAGIGGAPRGGTSPGTGAGGGAGGSSSSPGANPGANPGGGTTLTGTAATSPPSSPATSPTPGPAGSPAPSPAASPGPNAPAAKVTGSTTSVCVGVGPFGICLHL